MLATFDAGTFAAETLTAFAPEWIHDEMNRKTAVALAPFDFLNDHWVETDGQPFLTLRQWDAVDAIRKVYPDAYVEGETVVIPGVSLDGDAVELTDDYGTMLAPVLFAGVFDKKTVLSLSEI